MDNNRKKIFKEKMTETLETLKASLTREEFKTAFRTVIEYVKQTKELNAQELKMAKEMISSAVSEMKSEFSSHSSSMKTAEKEMMSYCMKEMKKMEKEHMDTMNYMRDKARDLEDGRDGKDGVDGKDGKDGSPDTPEQIRDKLETLKDENRLDRSAIKNLEEDISRLEKKIDSKPTGRTGMKKITYVKRHNLTSQVDGATKTFTLPADTLEVLGVWGTQFPINFNPGTDWTFAGRTLTLADEVAAPESGQTLYALIETAFYG